MFRSNLTEAKEASIRMSIACLLAAINADPIQLALYNGTMSWADCVMLDAPAATQADLDAFKSASLKFQASANERAAAKAEALRLAEQEAVNAAEMDRKYHIASRASEAWWEINRCTCTWDQIDALTMGSLVPCPCYKRVHLTEDGEPEECRFFNSPAGCRDGAHCVYKHVARDPSTMPCRFEASAVGCNPGFGRKCPYLHTKQQVAALEPAICRFDGRCRPSNGKVCPFKHTDKWSRAPKKN